MERKSQRAEKIWKRKKEIKGTKEEFVPDYKYWNVPDCAQKITKIQKWVRVS